MMLKGDKEAKQRGQGSKTKRQNGKYGQKEGTGDEGKKRKKIQKTLKKDVAPYTISDIILQKSHFSH